MTRSVAAEPDIENLSQEWRDSAPTQAPAPKADIFSAKQLLEMQIPIPEMLIENVLPKCGASLLNGAPKTGKTIIATQIGISVASGSALFGYNRVLKAGAVLMIEQDDPAATASVRNILMRSPIDAREIPLYLAPRVPYTIGPEFITWLGEEIAKRSLSLVIIDSYTAVRGSRMKGMDIVKAEYDDLAQLDALAKQVSCSLMVLHHTTAGKSALDWTLQAAGSFAMVGATESQIHIARFPELDGAPERLMRVRGRHSEDIQILVRFRKDTLDYEHVMEGAAAPLWPLMIEIRTAFGRQPFTPKNLSHSTGLSVRTSHRQIDRLYRAGALTKRGHGEYVLEAPE